MVSKLTRYAITLLLLAAALWIGKTVWDRYMESPWTRDGRIKADIVNISADVAGTVTDVLVRDNQVVQKGDVLFVVDKERYASALAQADAVLAAQKNGNGPPRQGSAAPRQALTPASSRRKAAKTPPLPPARPRRKCRPPWPRARWPS